MDTKKCFKCEVEKPISDYYRHSEMADGHLNKCKDCTKKDNIENRNKKIEYYRKYDRERSDLPHRVELRKRSYEEFKKSDDYSEKRNIATRKYRKNNPEKARAHRMLNYHLRSGHITKKPCEKCGDINSEAHHEDYSKPLDVVWLCDQCHKQRHKELNH